MEEAIVAVLWKFADEVRKGKLGLRDEKREVETKVFDEEEARAVKEVYSCGARLIRAPRNVDVEAMM
jgi:hypothetical protein